MRSYGWWWQCTVLPLLALGGLAGLLVVELPVVLGAALVFGGGAALVGGVIERPDGSAGRAWRGVLRSSVVWGPGAATYVSLQALLGAVGWPVLLLVVLASPLVAGNLLARLRDRTPRTLDDHELACAWRQTTVALRLARPHQWLRLVQLRAGYLDEMERRCPAGMQAWMDAGPGHEDRLETHLSRGG